MRKLFITIGYLLLGSLWIASAQEPCFDIPENKPFRSGEDLHFSVMYKWGAVNTEVAGAHIQLDSMRFQGTTVYHTDFTVKSAPFFDLFFKMREHFQSWFTPEDLRPLRFSRDTYEGGYTATNLYRYDWPAGVIHADLNFNGNGLQQMDIPLEGCAYDLPALIYSLRTLDMEGMKAGERKPLRFAIDDAVFDIRITCRGVETLKVRRVGKVQVHHFSCSVVSGEMFEGDQELQVWFSADKNKIPVAVMAPLRVGAVWCWIKRYDQLKNPFTALQ